MRDAGIAAEKSVAVSADWCAHGAERDRGPEHDRRRSIVLRELAAWTAGLRLKPGAAAVLWLVVDASHDEGDGWARLSNDEIAFLLALSSKRVESVLRALRRDRVLESTKREGRRCLRAPGAPRRMGMVELEVIGTPREAEQHKERRRARDRALADAARRVWSHWRQVLRPDGSMWYRGYRVHPSVKALEQVRNALKRTSDWPDYEGLDGAERLAMLLVDAVHYSNAPHAAQLRRGQFTKVFTLFKATRWDERLGMAIEWKEAGYPHAEEDGRERWMWESDGRKIASWVRNVLQTPAPLAFDAGVDEEKIAAVRNAYIAATGGHTAKVQLRRFESSVFVAEYAEAMHAPRVERAEERAELYRLRAHASEARRVASAT